MRIASLLPSLLAPLALVAWFAVACDSDSGGGGPDGSAVDVLADAGGDAARSD